MGHGLMIGGATGLALVLAEVSITGSTSVPMEAAIAVAVFVATMVWWLGRKFQSIDDRLETMQRFLDNLPCGDRAKCEQDDK